MEICGNCDLASGGAKIRVFCEKRMELVSIAGNCKYWRVRVLPEGFQFASDTIDISHVNPDEIIATVQVEQPKEDLPPAPQKRKRAPNKPKVIPPPPVPVTVLDNSNADEEEDIFA